MVQLVECPTLDFNSGHDLMVHELELCVRFYTDSMEPAWDSLSPSLSAPPLHSVSLSLSLKINNKKFIDFRYFYQIGEIQHQAGKATCLRSQR